VSETFLPASEEKSDGRLVRTIGRWSLAALMVNTMIGASIFGLPAPIAARLGKMSPAGYLIAAVGVGIIAACFAEVASQFREAGGPYLYARAAFGRFVGIQLGWFTWLSRIAAVSAVANLFITYLSEFFPEVKAPLIRAAVLTVLIGFLALVNYRGVSGGNRVSNFFTITKLTLLGFFVVAGLSALAWHPSLRLTPAPVHATMGNWFDAVILMVYAYGGFESALAASGEARNPRRDIPAALLMAMVATTILYIAVQYLVIHTIPNAGATTKPVVDSARQFLSPLGVKIVAVGTLVCAYGYLSANMLHVPRVTFAMGERGDFPAMFAAIHPRFRTPYLSIVVFAAVVVAFSVGGTFRWNAILAAVSKLLMYGVVAAALPALRGKSPGGDAYRLPYGTLFAVLGLLFTGVLVTRMRWPEVIVMSITAVLALLNWLWARRRGEPALSSQ
jgi:APA family basic amino acid/polyamine antiporter